MFSRQNFMKKQMFRHVVLWLLVADSPLLYVGAVTLEASAVTCVALIIAVIAAIIGSIVY